MSYQGYYQCICENGHYYEAPAVFMSDEMLCPTCDTKQAWFNVVDETNPPGPQGEVPIQVLEDEFLISEAVEETCEHCGHTKQLAPALFEVPTKEETDPLRVWLKDDGEEKFWTAEELFDMGSMTAKTTDKIIEEIVEEMQNPETD